MVAHNPFVHGLRKHVQVALPFPVLVEVARHIDIARPGRRPAGYGDLHGHIGGHRNLGQQKEEVLKTVIKPVAVHHPRTALRIHPGAQHLLVQGEMIGPRTSGEGRVARGIQRGIMAGCRAELVNSRPIGCIPVVSRLRQRQGGNHHREKRQRRPSQKRGLTFVLLPVHSEFLHGLFIAATNKSKYTRLLIK